MVKNVIEVETDGFSCEQKEDVCFFSFNQNAGEIATRIDIKDQLLSTLKKIDDSEKIRGLVIANSPTYKGDTDLINMISYFSKVIRSPIEDGAVSRFKNATLQLVNILVNFTKPTIAAMNGDIGQIFFGLSLACDFRFATSNTIFHFPSVKLGLPTTGVLAYYLIRFIGHHRSTELLLSKTSLSAPEAKDLGLLTGVTTDEELMDYCIEKLNVIKQYPSYGISAVKRVLQADASDVTNFIDKAFDEFILNLFMLKKKEL
ncbi:MAG: enoyl-CoA hydratase/isomerase family protein [Deltaproteobacteria bacterium]|jgi:enoyl-CoA hydratase/carnithine racemase|nr:enoyl-CoA hydratase/isomerase family protein [Deltaproteobacteria bacterium]